MILVECKPDKALIKLLIDTSSSKKIKCVGGKSEVIKHICNTKHQILQMYSRVLGLVDEDPGKPVPRIFDELKKIKVDDSSKLSVYCHKSNERHIISIYPRLEEWILNTAIEEGIDVTKYNLSKNPNEFHDKVNAALEDYQILIKELMSSSNFSSLKILIHEYYN